MAQNVKTVFDTQASQGLNVADPAEQERLARMQTYLRLMQGSAPRGGGSAAPVRTAADRNQEFVQRQLQQDLMRQAQRQVQDQQARQGFQGQGPQQAPQGGVSVHTVGPPQEQILQAFLGGQGVQMGGAGIDFPMQSPATFDSERQGQFNPLSGPVPAARDLQVADREDAQSHEISKIKAVAEAERPPADPMAGFLQSNQLLDEATQNAMNVGEIGKREAESLVREIRALPEGPAKKALVDRVSGLKITDPMKGSARGLFAGPGGQGIIANALGIPNPVQEVQNYLLRALGLADPFTEGTTIGDMLKEVERSKSPLDVKPAQVDYSGHPPAVSPQQQILDLLQTGGPQGRPMFRPTSSK